MEQTGKSRKIRERILPREEEPVNTNTLKTNSIEGIPKIMTAIAANTIRELVSLSNKYGIKREDVVTIIKDNGQYVLIHYSPSI